MTAVLKAHLLLRTYAVLFWTWLSKLLPARRRPWIQTRSGARWYPYDFKASDVRIEDLGACAYLNRWGGHAGVCSVAEHQVRVAEILARAGHSAWVQLQGAMHDAHEVYPPGDVLAPVLWGPRWLVWPIRRMSRRAAHAVRARVGLPLELDPAVKLADMTMLMSEAHARLPGGPQGWEQGRLLPPPVRVSDFAWAHDYAAWKWWFTVAELAERAADDFQEQRLAQSSGGRAAGPGWDQIVALRELATVAEREAAKASTALA